MKKFQKQETSEHIYVVATDTICEGYRADIDEDGNIVLYTKEEAENELKEMLEHEIDSERERCEVEGVELTEDVENPYFMTHMGEYIEGRKTLVAVRDDKLVGVITGQKPSKQL